jgi:hypothetical protein
MNQSKMIRILENHGIIFNVQSGQVYVTDEITENATKWTEDQLYIWLGY